MTDQTVSAIPNVEWNDSVVFVSFQENGNQIFAGFVHFQLAIALGAGLVNQVTQILQITNQQQVQWASFRRLNRYSQEYCT